MKLKNKLNTKPSDHFYQQVDDQKYKSQPSCLGMISIFLVLFVILLVIFLFIYLNK